MAFRNPYPDNPLMAQAYFDGLHWATGDDEVMARFRAETGNQWRPGRNVLEQAIDKATGADMAFCEAFVKWFDDAIWGTNTFPEPAPPEEER